jgi:hypothetical protein
MSAQSSASRDAHTGKREREQRLRPDATVGITPTTHVNGRIYWVTKTLVSSFGIDSMLRTEAT